MEDIENKFRLAQHTCDRCHDNFLTIGSVWIGKTVKAWCYGCIQEAQEHHIPVRVDTMQCERCDAQVVMTYGVFWQHRNMRWCEECTLEVEKVQKAKGNTWQ